MPNHYTTTHKSPGGPGDSRPTAQQIIQDESLINALRGLSVVVTGASSGVGIPTARALASTGATVYATVRDLEKGRQALADVLSPNESQSMVELIHMDQTSLSSVQSAGNKILQKCNGKLSVLVCNAGIMEPPYGRTIDGNETQFSVNHLSHFLLFQLLVPALMAGATAERASRVVIVSSMAHKHHGVNFGDYNFESKDVGNKDVEGSYTPQRGYGQSKTANVYMANQIERLYGSRGIHAMSLHPGGVKTGLHVYVSQERLDMLRKIPGISEYMKSPEQGAATQVYAAVGKEWEGRGGMYMEDCDVAKPEAETEVCGMKGWGGYHARAYDKDGEEKLWEDSLKMVEAWR